MPGPFCLWTGAEEWNDGGWGVMSPARMEAFSDGVIAAIITIMVLELKLPEHDGMALYSGTCLLPGISCNVLWTQARRNSAKRSHASGTKMASSVMLYGLAMVVAHWRPWWSLILIGVVALLWLMPPERRGSGEAASHPHGFG